MDFNVTPERTTNSWLKVEKQASSHNSSVDEARRQAGVCAQLHLPTGRMCTLAHGHPGSCEFVAPDQVEASLARRRSAEG